MRCCTVNSEESCFCNKIKRNCSFISIWFCHHFTKKWSSAVKYNFEWAFLFLNLPQRGKEKSCVDTLKITLQWINSWCLYVKLFAKWEKPLLLGGKKTHLFKISCLVLTEEEERTHLQVIKSLVCQKAKWILQTKEAQWTDWLFSREPTVKFLQGN